MGFLDYLNPVKTGKKLLELQMALIGKHVFNNLLTEEERDEVNTFVTKGLKKGKLSDEKIAGLDDKVRYLLIALTMKKTGADYGKLKGFKIYVQNPFAIEKYSAALCATAEKVVKEKHDIEVGF